MTHLAEFNIMHSTHKPQCTNACSVVINNQSGSSDICTAKCKPEQQRNQSCRHSQRLSCEQQASRVNAPRATTPPPVSVLELLTTFVV